MAQKEVAEAGKLYVVPTPVGNLDDMTVRAVNVLKAVDTILAEDTRTSAVLMKHFGIETKMQSHHKFNEHETAAPIVQRLLAGERIALVSDAGTPAISDPGFLLVRECRRCGVLLRVSALIPDLGKKESPSGLSFFAPYFCRFGKVLSTVSSASGSGTSRCSRTCRPSA